MRRLLRFRGRPSVGDLLGLASVLVFAVTLALMLWPGPETPAEDARLLDPSTAIQLGDEWLGLYFQGRKVGMMHMEKRSRKGGGFRFATRTRLQVTPAGAPMDLDLRAELSAALALEAFEFALEAGPTRLRGRGAVAGRRVDLTLDSGGAESRRTFELARAPVLRQLDGPLMAKQDLRPGSTFRFQAFDPLTQTDQEVAVEVVGPDRLVVMGREVPVTRLRQRVSGLSYDTWINGRGEVLRQELGLGLVAVRETEAEARWGIGREAVDLAAATTIEVAGLPPRLDRAVRLDVRLGGVDELEGFDLDDGRRQRREGDRLWVRLEDASRGGPLRPTEPALAPFLAAEPLIEADHPDVRAAAAEATAGATDTLDASRRLVAWIRRRVEQRPVHGVPGALETLRTGVGDCNEHSALFAALARAAGVPTRVVVGLVYRDDRFGYHAWNEVWAGADRWVSVDPAWGQIPADVGHLRFVTGGLHRQVELLRLMGRLRIEPLAFDQ